MKTTAIIGGGITGLTAAFRLQERGIPVTLYEAGTRLGGVIRSVRENGFLAECGPNTILETSPKISALVEDLGLTGRRMYSAPAANNRYLVRNGRLVLLPDSFSAFLTTQLFSSSAKFRLLAEPFIKPAPVDAEESVADFVLRRLGRDFLDYAINPLVGGVYAGDPAQLSVKQAFPKLHALEQRYHSLIAGQVLGARERKRRAEVSKQDARKFSFDEGLQVLIDQLKAELRGSIRLNTEVSALFRRRHGWQVVARTNGRDRVEDHDSVLFTGMAHKLSELQIVSHSVTSELGSLGRIHYPPVSSVVLGFRREDVAHALEGFGVLIPEVEKFSILGTIFSSSLFPNRAPAGHVTLTCYLGGARNPDLALLDPKSQLQLVLRDLRRLLGVTGAPVFQHHYIFPNAIPQYNVGYGKFKELMNSVETQCPGFFMAGNYRDGISLGDSILSGDNAAARIATFLRTNQPHNQPEQELQAV